ncbi:MAG: ATP/GTP-binding protein [Actinomycetaceae bacterium]|nr:ATP/GTP-binding protein [Actinomycetaceae bacterium]
MGRRSNKRPYSEGHRPLNMDRLASMPRSVDRGGETFSVQRLSSAAKTYTCPGCHRPITPGSQHVVVWREEGRFGLDHGVDSRRHWHPHCWDSGVGSSTYF